MGIEDKNPFPEEDGSMEEYNEVVDRIGRERDWRVIQAELEKYQAVKIENLSAKKYAEHQKIIKYLERKIGREDPAREIRKDNEYLNKRFKGKFN